MADFDQKLKQLLNALDIQRKNIDEHGKKVDKQRENIDEHGGKVDKLVDVMADLKNVARNCFLENRKSVQTIKETICSYIKNESDMIENEMNQYIEDYLKKDRRFRSFNISNVTGKWKKLYVPYIADNKFRNKSDITEFDGLYILTTDPDYFIDENDGTMIREKKGYKVSSMKTYFCVVEAKHSITNNDINTKIKQMKAFQDYIRSARVQHENITAVK